METEIVKGTAKINNYFRKLTIVNTKCEVFVNILPDKIVFNGTTTICIFPGGKKVIARPSKDDMFDPEVGVAMCIMKRIFGSRTAFKKVVNSGYVQERKIQ